MDLSEMLTAFIKEILDDPEKTSILLEQLEKSGYPCREQE